MREHQGRFIAEQLKEIFVTCEIFGRLVLEHFPAHQVGKIVVFQHGRVHPAVPGGTEPAVHWLPLAIDGYIKVILFEQGQGIQAAQFAGENHHVTIWQAC